MYYVLLNFSPVKCLNVKNVKILQDKKLEHFKLGRSFVSCFWF